MLSAHLLMPCFLVLVPTQRLLHAAHNYQLVAVTANVASSTIGQSQERKMEFEVVGASNAGRIYQVCARVDHLQLYPLVALLCATLFLLLRAGLSGSVNGT